MQIKYIKQQHQEKAINSIVDLFQGQIKTDSFYDIFDGEAVCANELLISAKPLPTKITELFDKINEILNTTTTNAN